MLAQLRQRAWPSLAQAATRLQWAAFSGTATVAKPPPDPEPVPLSKMYDSFLDGTSSSYLEEIERQYNEDPASVDKTWAGFFRHVGAQLART